MGRALFLGGEDRREKSLYSETRFNRLLTARGPMLRALLARMFRMLAAAKVSLNWREMAQFILNEGDDEETAEQARAAWPARTTRRNGEAPKPRTTRTLGQNAKGVRR